MKNDGYITIGTKLNTKDLERGIRKAKTELNRLDKEAKKLTDQKLSLEADNTKLQETIDKYDELFNQAKQYEAELKQMEASGQLWSSSYDVTQKKLENINSQIASEEKGMLKAGQQIDKNNEKLETINKKLKDNASNQGIVTEKVKVMNTELQKSRGIDTLKSSIDNISGKMSGIIHKAIKWGLAIFSIRSAYSFIRSSISTVSQYNQKIATDIEYIRWAMAMTLKPVIEYVIKLAYQLLGIIRSIIYALFKYDIFAKAGADAFKKAKESTSGIDNNLGKSVKKAKELNKQLASFDEMNILGDNTKMAGDTGASGGADGGAIQMPSMEIPEISDIKINIPEILGKIEEAFGKIKTNIAPMVQDFFTSIGQRFYDNASGWTTPLSNTFGDFFKVLGQTASISIGGIGDVFTGLVKTVRGIFQGDIPTMASGMFDILKGVFEMGIGSLGTILNGLSTPFRLAFNEGLSIAEEVFNKISAATGIKEIKWDNMMVGLGNTLDKIKEKIKNAWENIKGFKIGINWDALKSGLQSKIDEIKKKFTKLRDNIKDIFGKIGTKIGNIFKEKFKTIFNKLVSAIEDRLNRPISAINSMIGAINKLLPKKQELSKLKTIKLPRLAKGGIVNLPSAGVPVGTAIAGERGAEGVIPLTDSQQMALLGEAIGKYITVNANITNTMNGRVISRELQKIQNDDNFAYNR